jgi:hypothetical protein
MLCGKANLPANAKGAAARFACRAKLRRSRSAKRGVSACGLSQSRVAERRGSSEHFIPELGLAEAVRIGKPEEFFIREPQESIAA